MASQHSTLSDFSSRYKFNGKELDKETGWYYYGARYYDPQVSTWLSVDPLAEKYIGFSPYNFTLGNPVRLVDVDGKKNEDWYEKLDKKGKGTGEVTWFNGSNDVEGYEHIGYDYVVTNTDVNGNRTQIKYDGDTKSSYIYNAETGKFDLLKNYDYSDSSNSNKIKSLAYEKLLNPILRFGDQFTKSLIGGFQGAGIMVYETARGNFDPSEEKDIMTLGYKPIVNLNSTLVWNNGKWVHTDLHSQGMEHYANQQLKDTYYSLSRIKTAIKYYYKFKDKLESFKVFK